MNKQWRKALSLVLGAIGFSGMGLFFMHIAEYGLAFHLTPIDHGVAGLIMIVGSVAGALGIFKWGRGK